MSEETILRSGKYFSEPGTGIGIRSGDTDSTLDSSFKPGAQSPVARATPSLLRLPVELRLEIYAHCSTFGLLQLAHTSSQLHTEINSFPTVIRTSPGYFHLYSGPRKTWIFDFNRYHRCRNVKNLVSDPVKSYATSQACWDYRIQPRRNRAKYPNLTVLDIKTVVDAKERALFRRLYYGGPVRHLVCDACHLVVQETAIVIGGGGRQWQTSCGCKVLFHEEGWNDGARLKWGGMMF